MQFYFEPDPGPDAPTAVRMVVEISKGSSNKYEYEPSFGLFRLSRTLYSPMRYPGDYGFIPGTIAEDGEPVDALCLVTSPSFSGCLSHVRPVAVLDIRDGEVMDHKILAVSTRDPRYASVQSLLDIDQHVQQEVEHFFEIYKDLEGHQTQTGGWRDKQEAHRVIAESRRRHLDSYRMKERKPSPVAEESQVDFDR